MAFAVGALAHFGVLLTGLAHRRAAIAETVIGAVLLAGIVGLRMRMRLAPLLSQAFALLGTILGAVLIWIGVGPRSTFDFVLHGVMLTLLVSGMAVTLRSPRRTFVATDAR